MRFSILALKPLLPGQSTSNGWFESLCRFIAENNVSAVCIPGCEESLPQSLVEEQLGPLGLKYDQVWIGEAGEHGGPGSAVLSHLPILSTAALRSAQGYAAAARLGIALDLHVDLYCMHPARAESAPGDSARALVDFVSDSAGALDNKPAPAKPRRGRPPLKPPGSDRPEPVRMVFLAGLPAGDGKANETLRGAGFSLADPASIACGETAIYIRPGLRPTSSGTVPRGGDGSAVGEGEWTARFLSFEV